MITQKNFKVIQNSFEVNNGGKYIITNNDIHSSGENNLYNCSVDSNIEVRITDKERGARIVSPKVETVIPKSILNMNEGGISFVQNIMEEDIKGINTIKKVFEFKLLDESGKEIRKFNDEKIKVSIKLSKEEKEALGEGDIVAYYYDKDNNKWEEVQGEYFDNSGVFTFVTDHFSRFAIGCINTSIFIDNKNCKTNNTDDILLNKAVGENKTSINANTGDNNVVIGISILCLVAAGFVSVRVMREKKNK